MKCRSIWWLFVALVVTCGPNSGFAAAGRDDTAAAQPISGIRIGGAPVLVFDHTRDKQAANNIPDGQIAAWKSRDGTINLTIPHFQNYRMRGRTLDRLEIDSSPTYDSLSRSSETPEQDYDYHHWILSPYTQDGATVYALAHSEWYACLINADCATTVPATANSSGSYQLNSWANVVSLFVSTDGGATWALHGQRKDHVVAMEALTWTGSSELSAAIYRVASNASGMRSPSRIIREGSHYYAMGWLIHRDFGRTDAATEVAPVDKYGWVLMRTRDISSPGSWEGWESGTRFSPLSLHRYSAFMPKQNGRDLNAANPQIVYDTVAQQYIAVFTVYGDAQKGAYYTTTSSLANPSWSEARLIEGSTVLALDPRSATPAAACNRGFISVNYPSLLDPDSPGFNFEYTAGNLWLFYVVNPVRACGGDNMARDLYRVRLLVSRQNR